ncbi:enoyl-CoA hydratase/isomerase family protein [Kribbella solani]|uniref:enoyl-CoA hydratase/isomerase family protein n=1 Tax=Kribbella solani TaxID=236067 RepID=UPI0029AB19DB|nr:enoyl-CoA hydratase-related protein [Kribbella solani]MDX2972667.1 enoyl-CoA hydratase-related protein [Kribbella solani]
MSDPILLTEYDGAVLVVTLNRPEQLNALTSELVHALTETWTAAADPSVRAVVVTGAGRGFCAGADLRSPRVDAGPQGLRHTYNPHILGLTGLEKPVIAAVNGPAAGAGLALAFGADLRIAAPAAKFVPAFSRIGLVPDSGATYLIPRLIGYSRSVEWLTTGRAVDAAEALQWGLVNEVVDLPRLLPRAMELAHQLAAVPGMAAGLTKRALTQTSRRLLLEQLELEAELQEIAVHAPGRAEARARTVERIATGKETS